ncbi:VUT family protein [Hyphococcus sp.]|uniref:VUT family protein n=1 Tax=Hyphococcus sp. TaxID=2038636 RepID=UPI003CCB8EBC
MEAAVERYQSPETAVERFSRQSAAFTTALARMLMLAMMLTPVLLAAIITVDLPLHVFDRFAGDAIAARPSNWLSRGGFIMALAPLLIILFARKYGGGEASRAVTASWGLAAVAVFAELSYLAPSLEEGDLPGVRFTVAFTASAMAAQYMTASVYDIVRGGGRWWRAPLFAALFGYLTFALLYFPGLYIGTGAPWLNWMVGDFAIKLLIALAFLPVYGLLRHSLKPKGGFGGR